MHEAQLHERNSYITLTYHDDNAPPGMSLRHRDWQLFAKKLRKEVGPFKFYMCGEYGEQFSRPHFHACLFGIDFDDKVPLRQLASTSKLFHSATLERLWKHGFASVGAVTFQSAAYVARYVMKKVTGDKATPHYTYIDADGEIHDRKPEYNQMSRGGRNGRGLAAEWFDKYHKDVYPADHVITNRQEAKPPRYYDNLLKKKIQLCWTKLRNAVRQISTNKNKDQNASEQKSKCRKPA